MKKSLPIYFFIAVLIIVSWIFRSNHETQPADEVTIPVRELPKIHAVDVPDQIDFAGEPVPTKIFDVEERLDRELLVNTYWHSNSLQLFKLASRWFPLIEQILEEQCVPDDFKYMALAESGLRNVVSYSDAVGVWQFLEGTGKEYGLEINRVVDERYDIEKSTEAACRYLKDAHEDFGSWTLAAASYNIGKARLKRLLRDQRVETYYDLYLNDETARYVFRIIAMKRIFSNPEKYGFYLDSTALYEPLTYKRVIIDHSIDNLADFAQEHGTNYKTLKLLNPWLRQPYLKNRSGKAYDIKLPI